MGINGREQPLEHLQPREVLGESTEGPISRRAESAEAAAADEWPFSLASQLEEAAKTVHFCTNVANEARALFSPTVVLFPQPPGQAGKTAGLDEPCETSSHTRLERIGEELQAARQERDRLLLTARPEATAIFTKDEFAARNAELQQQLGSLKDNARGFDALYTKELAMWCRGAPEVVEMPGLGPLASQALAHVNVVEELQEKVMTMRTSWNDILSLTPSSASPSLGTVAVMKSPSNQLSSSSNLASNSATDLRRVALDCEAQVNELDRIGQRLAESLKQK
eukprot:TRINITY_DN15273_c0_g1_i2.p1 TRINITY_DN15273_c0_g1~~TRINITY_DN15273_c0_g1_i2.p1  ORF type:complete len:281 (+),score=59.18 TRINITY_DN15273_c0_g1_i2:800-1642(+)